MVGPLLNLWGSQGKVYPNQKGLLWGLLLWYAPFSLWHRVLCLGNLHDAWWIRRNLDPPSSPPKNIALQASTPPPSPSAKFLATCPWWGRIGEASGWFLRLWPHVRVRGARFLALCFVDFRNFRDSTEYGVACAGLSELSCFYEWNQTQGWPDASPNE